MQQIVKPNQIRQVSRTIKARGFTLIELMITVAIVAVLAAVALPAYQIYTVRARIADGLVVSGAAKRHVEDVASSGSPKASSYSAGYSPSNETDNVQNIVIAADTGVLTITFKPSVADIGANTLVLEPSTVGNNLPDATNPAGFAAPENAVVWTCLAAGATPVIASTLGGSLPARIVPPSCR